MKILLIQGTLFTAIIIVVFLRLRHSVRNKTAVIASCGKKKSIETTLSPRHRAIVLLEIVRQQRIAFSLCAISVIVGLMLATIVIVMALNEWQNVKLVAGLVSIAGDIWIGQGALKLYRDVSKQMRDLFFFDGDTN